MPLKQSVCEYCGKLFASAQTKNTHKARMHKERLEATRY